MLKLNNRKVKDKRAVSLMLSYVLLVVIGLSLAIGVYVWLKKYANVEETPKCPEEVSLIIQDYSCDSIEKTISLTVKNNGLFIIDGYDIRGVGNKTKEPIFPLTDSSGLIENGKYIFEIVSEKLEPLKPSQIDVHVFSYDVTGIVGDLEKIKMSPFKIQNENIIQCNQATMIQEVEC